MTYTLIILKLHNYNFKPKLFCIMNLFFIKYVNFNNILVNC